MFYSQIFDQMPNSLNVADPAHQELIKALNVGYARQDQTGAPAFLFQDLRNALISTTFNAKDVPFWQDISKGSTDAFVHQYTTVDSVGPNVYNSGWFVAGDLPQSTDPDINRRFSNVYFQGRVKQWQHPLQFTANQPGPGGVGSEAEDKQVWSGTLEILRSMEQSLLYAKNANYKPDGATDGIAPDGMEVQICGAADATFIAGGENIIDLRGGYLTDEHLNKSSEIIFENHGTAEKLYLAGKTLRDLSNYLNAARKVELTAGVIQDGRLMHGVPVKGFNSNFGSIDYRPGKLTTNSRRLAPTAAIGSNPPAAPTAGTTPSAVGAPGGGQVSKFTASESGNVKYKITAFNPSGESAPLTSGTVATTATNIVTLQVTHGGGKWSTSNKTGITGYRLYRTGFGATGDYGFIAEFPYVDLTDDPLYDMNLWLPLTDRAFMCDMDNASAIDLRLLAPLKRLNLPITGTVFQFLLFLYSTGPILVAPKKHVEIVNIGAYNAA